MTSPTAPGRITRGGLALLVAITPVRSAAQLPDACLDYRTFQTPQAYLDDRPAWNSKGAVWGRRLADTLVVIDHFEIARHGDVPDFRRSWKSAIDHLAREDSSGVEIGLAYLVAWVQALHPLDLDYADVAWGYYIFSGRPEPVLYFVEHDLRNWSHLTALQSLRGPLTPDESRVVLSYACDAAWLLLNYNADAAFELQRGLRSDVVDARLLLPHAYRLLDPEARSAFRAIARKLYPAPHRGEEALAAHSWPDWQWQP